MWIKICANTCLADALAAARLGADAVGFVFAPSKRQVTAAQVRAMTASLPGELEKVGVFPALAAVEMVDVAQEAGLTAVQLHGGWDEALTAELSRLAPHLRLIQTAHWELGEAQAGQEVEARLARMPAEARVLIDAKVGGTSGGMGRTFDWQAAVGIFEARRERQLILAGGLRPDNVARAIATLRPWGVDVASGVEAEPGRKDLGKLKEFIAEARKEWPC